MILLDIILTNQWGIVIGIAIALVLYYLLTSNKELQKQKDNYFKQATETDKQLQIDKNESQNKLREQNLTFQKREAELKVSFQNWAIEEFEKFKKFEIERIQKEAENQALNAANVVLQKWKIENEAKIRQDAINRSYSVNLGKITEHLVPYHQSFLSQFNPKDARFIGSPIDLIVFDGYADKKDELQIYLVEIKTGNSKLTEIQKKIKAAVLNGNIRWAEINPDNNPQTLTNSSEIQNMEPLKQLSYDFEIEDDVEKLIATILVNDSDTAHTVLEKVKSVIQWATVLVGHQNYSSDVAIEKAIANQKLIFKTDKDRNMFVNSISKLVE